MNCTCLQPTHLGYNPDNPSELCAFCTSMLWAARLEQRLRVVEQMADETTAKIQSRDYDNLEDEVKAILKSERIPDENEVESSIEQTLKDFDLSEYITKDDLPAEITSEVESQLAEADVVKDVAAGAAAGAMGIVQTYRNEVDELKNQVVALRRQSLPFTHTLGQRLRWLLTGNL